MATNVVTQKRQTERILETTAEASGSPADAGRLDETGL
jgi:hypothetical protein